MLEATFAGNTTNSSIAVGYDDGHIEVVRVDENPDLPFSLSSIEYLHRSGNRAAGEAAVNEFLVTGAQATKCGRCSLVLHDAEGTYSDCKQYRRGGGCHDSRLISGLKSELSNEEFDHTHSWATDFSLLELVAIVLGDLKRRADRLVGEPVHRVVIGHPVAFVGTTGGRYDELQELALSRLRQSALVAGFQEVVLMPEPAAAMLDEVLPIGYASTVDFGGGTFDVAVMDVGVHATPYSLLAISD